MQIDFVWGSKGEIQIDWEWKVEGTVPWYVCWLKMIFWRSKILQCGGIILWISKVIKIQSFKTTWNQCQNLDLVVMNPTQI